MPDDFLSTHFNQVYDDINLRDHGIESLDRRIILVIHVGIDIAKLNHFASAISSDGEVFIQPFKFTNDGDGFQLLISKLESFEQDSNHHRS